MMDISRFAPAPTGLIHVGNLKTWLLASYQSNCHLRIDDTNHTASSEFIDNLYLIAGLLDIKISKIYFQSDNINRYKEFLNLIKPITILEDGCIKLNLKNKTISTTIGKRNTTNTITYNPVLLKSNGSATYFLATMADDYYDNVNKIIRGNDHNETSFIQSYVDAFLKCKKEYITIPFVLDKAGGKISKSKGAKDVISLIHTLSILPISLKIYLLKPASSMVDIKSFVNGTLVIDKPTTFVRFDEEKLINMNRMVLSVYGFEYFYSSLILYIKYHLIKKEFNKEFMKVIFDVYVLRYKTLQEFIDKYIYFDQLDNHSMLSPFVEKLNALYIKKVLNPKYKRVLQLIMQYNCDEVHTPTATELIKIFNARKKKTI